MKTVKWGKGLAVRIPAAMVKSLALKEGDDVEIRVADKRVLAKGGKTDLKEALIRLRRLRVQMPKDFRFDREEANER